MRIRILVMAGLLPTITAGSCAAPGPTAPGQQPNAPPVLLAIEPASARRGTSTAVTLTGSGFLPGLTTIHVSGLDIPATLRSVPGPTQILASFDVPPAATLGARTVTVVTPNGTSNAVTFTVEADPPFRAAAISAGGDHTCALMAGGAAFCWGQGVYGQLGNSATGDQPRPKPVSGGLVFTAITAGGAHTCALTAAGQAWCWGAGEHGRLGNGTRSDRAVPVPVSGGHVFRSLSAGYEHTCGVTDTGRAWC